jgi:hypothetical protein
LERQREGPGRWKIIPNCLRGEAGASRYPRQQFQVGSVMLLGRVPERAALSQLLDAARAGRSGVLVLRGEPGAGKTALLEWVIESAAGLRVARVAGVESEMELAFAALQQLCAPMLDNLQALPGPQGEALGVAFGLDAGAAPDRFLVGLATLSLLSEAAEQ